MFFGIKVFGKINKVPYVTSFYAQKIQPTSTGDP